MRIDCLKYLVAFVFVTLSWGRITLSAQTSGESGIGVYNTVRGDTVAFQEGLPLQYRLRGDRKWRLDTIENTSKEGLKLDGKWVAWSEMEQAKGYRDSASKVLEYGYGKNLLIALFVILALLAGLLVWGLLWQVIMSVFLPRWAVVALVLLGPYLIILISIIGIRFRRIRMGPNWQVIDIPPAPVPVKLKS